ncbi:MAG: acyl-CoA dehydrogenase family protein [Spirochaetales bacterium]|nr:acyl-CoA dehydrogenase family protein [Spirochaetales bacterium]
MPDWNKEQKEFYTLIVDIARKLNDENLYNDDHGLFSLKKWKLLCDSGLIPYSIEEKYGGLEKDFLSLLFLLEGLGYGCEDAGLNFSFCTQIISAQLPIHKYGTEWQKTHYLPAIGTGETITAHAITEPDSGSDAFNMNTTAYKMGDRYILKGSKTFITNGPVADIFIIYAITDKQKKALGGISAFIVEKESKGLVIGKPLEKMGLRTSPTCELFFNNCEIPRQNLIGKEGAGFKIFNYVMKREILCNLAINIGEMRKLLEATITYAKSRIQFGKPISKHQAISHHIADMKIKLEAAKALIYKAGLLLNNKKPCSMEIAIAKVTTTENYVNMSETALQIFGGYGYMKEYQIEKYLRNSVASKIYSGSSEMQRNIIANLLGL